LTAASAGALPLGARPGAACAALVSKSKERNGACPIAVVRVYQIHQSVVVAVFQNLTLVQPTITTVS
jgi:hypothetical protein